MHILKPHFHILLMSRIAFKDTLACAAPESFIRWAPTSKTILRGEGGSKYPIIPLYRHDDSQIMNGGFVITQGIRARFVKKLYIIFVIFQGGSRPPFLPLERRMNCNVTKTRHRKGSDSVIECLTRDRGAAGSSLTSVTVLCP